MRIRTLLNKFEHLKSFVYKKEYIEENGGQERLIIEIVPRKNSQAICSVCGEKHSTYDHKPMPRDFEFVPLWGMPTFFRYQMRRVSCPEHGVRIEQVPWARGKRPITKSYGQFLAHWAKRLSWQEVAESFKTTWHSVFTAVEQMVEYGLAHRDLSQIEAIGVDEIHYGKGHKYLTMVYQLDEGKKRLLFVEKKRKVKSLLKCFRQLGKENCQNIKFVCSDMWKPYLKVIKKKLPNALNILDRFHIVKKLNEAVNDVRIEEHRRLKKEGYEPILEKSKYCFLKNEENLTEKQETKLNDILQYDLKSVRAYLLKVSFEAFWQYNSPYWAQWYLNKWCTRAMRSRLEPMKKFVRTLRRHDYLLMNWFKAKKAYSSGAVEGLNRKVNLVTRRSYGFRNYDVLKIALFHTMGNLPEPEKTHSFFG
jgi:transposase